MVLMMIATVIAIAAKGTLRPLIGVAVIGVILMVLSVA